TDRPWGIIFPPESIAGSEYPGTPLHPVMLYEMAINLSIFSLLWFLSRKQGYKNGFVFALYIALYSSGRFFVEYFRADSLMLGPMKAAQVASLTLILITGWVVLKKGLWRA
ncbi:MAG: prolipoprotein diacylglyceryl transferase, partial [Deltaproteobacteria bacterium]|nr:prolipoprotein diacylglyceryl transferase [Deltaproteobacteria bacterium]